MQIAIQPKTIDIVRRRFHEHVRKGVGPEDSHEMVARELKMPLTHVIDILRP
jgi:hypothetical protein